MGFIKLNSCPCWVVEYMCSEYAPVKNVIVINVGMVHKHKDEIDVISIISLTKFSDGGAAMLMDASKNIHIDIFGVEDNNPFIRYILRVLVFS